MTCFFPCAGAVLKTEGTRAQPTAVAPPPARQLGAAGEPPMPAPGRQGATASPDQVRLRGDPPSGARGSAVARPAGRQAGRQAGRWPRGCPRELLRAALPACGCGRAARTAAPLGASPSPGPSPAPAALGGHAAPPAPAALPAGGEGRSGGQPGAVRAAAGSEHGRVCGCVCEQCVCVCETRCVCIRGQRGSSAWRGAEVLGKRPAVLADGRAGGGGAGTAGHSDTGAPGQRDTGTLERRGGGVSAQHDRRLRAGTAGQGDGGRGAAGPGPLSGCCPAAGRCLGC